MSNRLNDYMSETRGDIPSGIYQILTDDEKQKVDSILETLNGITVEASNEIINAVKEIIPEKAVLQTRAT